MRFASAVVLVCSTGLLFGACAVDDEVRGTPGEQHRLSFRYREATGCLDGCPVANALMIAARLRIQHDPLYVPVTLQAASSDERVLAVETESTFICCRDADGHECGVTNEAGAEACTARGQHLQRRFEFTVEGISPGIASLIALRTDGTEWDRIPITVADPARVRIELGGQPVEAEGATLRRGTASWVTVTPLVDDGTPAHGDAVQVLLSDVSVAGIRGWTSEGMVYLDDVTGLGAQRLSARAVGSLTLTVRVREVERSVTLNVTE